MRAGPALLAVALAAVGCGSSGPSASPSTDINTTTSAPAAAPWQTTRPPYPVAETEIRLVDQARPTVSRGRRISPQRALTTRVWFPEAPGRWPLVVFAHGFNVSPTPYLALLRTWAGHGYVVAAPEFPLTDPDIAGADVDENDINNQPDDVRYVTDALVAATGPVAARIDPSRVAVAGHSDGGETALAAAVGPVPAGEPRYRAVIAMSVQPLPAGAPATNPPILVTQGDADTINPPALGRQTYAAARAPKYYLDLRGGGHLPPLEAGSEWLPGIEAITVAFLDVYVAGDAPRSEIAAAAAPQRVMTLRAT